MRWLPMMVGAMTRSAPARMSFGSADSSTARETMRRDGLSVRAVSTT